MLNKILQTLLLIAIPIWINAQDLHFSNFQSFANYFNPATTGMDAQNLKANFQYRSQWANIPEAYRSLGVNIQQQKDRFSWGGILHKNGAGIGSLQTTGGLLTGAYQQQLARGDNKLSLGIGLGFIQKRFDPSALKFDTQYRPEIGFEIGNGNGENFIQTNSTTIDFTIGGLWEGAWNGNQNIKTQLGFALAHIHLPNMGFNDAMNELNAKTVVHGQVSLPISSKSQFMPYFLFQKQNVHQECLIGARTKRQVNAQTNIRTGIAYRLKDAIVFQVGLDWGNKSLTLNYDLNNSGLTKVTNGQGAFELAFGIELGQQPKNRKKDRDKDGVYDYQDKCPDIFGSKKYKGCPIPKKEMVEEAIDTDGDQVPDEYDDCPLIKGPRYLHGCPDKDKDGVVDPDDACPNLAGSPMNGGCPIDEKDTDRDGVPDAEDYCVFLRGSIKFHGCPDSDKDGISDIDDDCPYLKGTKSNNGCPSKNQRRNELKAIVEFDVNRHFIYPEYMAELDFLVQEIQDVEQYKIVIAGHTDSEGDAAFNYALGQKRAFAIQDYLISQGVNSFKVQTISYGEARPKRNNEIASGKARNRRAEVQVILE